MNASLELGPILRSLRHHRGAFSLLVLEVAFGFVILVHTLTTARYYVHLRVQPIGLAQEDLIVARRNFLHPRDVAAARATARADLARLGGAGIAAAAVDTVLLPDTIAFPTMLTRAGPTRGHLSWELRASGRAAEALGLVVVAGRSLDGVPIEAAQDGATPVLLTRSAAEALYDHAAAAVGQLLQSDSFGAGRIVGVVTDAAYRGTWVPHAGSLVIVLAEPASEHEIIYVLQGTRGHRAAVIEAARHAFAATGDGDATFSVAPLTPGTTRYMRLSEGAVIVLIWTGLLVVAVAVSGALALASFSVAERTRQIGVRRALGARRSEIVRYFLLENVVLTGFGLGLGMALAAALNLVLRRIMGELVLTADVILVAMAVFVVTGLLSALVPARRAAAIPPWAATRTL